MNFFGKQSFNGNNNVKSFNNNEYSNYAKLGHKTVEQVKNEMNRVKYDNFKEVQDSRKTEVKPNNNYNNIPNYKSRVDNLRNINRG